MLRIPCPFCGEREEDEFVYGGDAKRVRPGDPTSMDSNSWTDYLYNATNTKGEALEWWWHAQGCTKWFQITRNTVTHLITPVNEDPQ